MSALNIEHLKLILHHRFAVKVIAGFDIISETLFRLKEHFSPADPGGTEISPSVTFPRQF